MCGAKPGGIGRMSVNAGALSECEVETLMKPDHTALQMRSSGRAGIGRSSGEGLNTGRHKKAPVRC